MSREIKFRAYDSANKKMEYNVNVNQGKPVKQGYQWFNTENTVYNSELMQYTGLKDINGVEIYEGDVLSIFIYSYLKFSVVVKFGEYKQDGSGGEYGPRLCFGFYAEAINPHQEDEDGFRLISDYYHTSSLLEFDEVEVLGNIYENPELLEQKNGS